MRRDPYPMHGPRRRWFKPWRRICRCGLDAYPCVVLRTVRGYRLNEAKAWRNAERRAALQRSATARRILGSPPYHAGERERRSA